MHPSLYNQSLTAAGVHTFTVQRKKTMLIAQQLYEGVDIGTEGSVGLITYMRTDSFHISEQALALAAISFQVNMDKIICQKNPMFMHLIKRNTRRTRGNPPNKRGVYA